MGSDRVLLHRSGDAAAMPDEAAEPLLGPTGPTRVIPEVLVVGRADDPAEAAADRAADTAVRRLAGRPVAVVEQVRIPGAVHRSATATAAPIGLAGGPLDVGTDSALRRQLGRGQPLGDPVRQRMQSAFDRDLSGVRVHDGVAAAQLNSAVSARAFTVGSDIFFGAGQYRPEDAAGERALAHEIAHTLQGDAPIHRVIRRNGPTDLLDPVVEAAQRAGTAIQQGAQSAATAVQSGAQAAGTAIQSTAQSVATAALSGAQAAGTAIQTGATTVAGKAQQGTMFAGQKASQGATFAEEKAVQGATFAKEKATQGATFAEEKAVQGATFAKEKATQGAQFAEQKGRQGATFAQEKAVQGATFAKEKAIQGAQFAEEKGRQAAAFAYDKATTGIDLATEKKEQYTRSLHSDETIAAKGGTVKGFDQAEAMATADAKTDADQRFAALADLLIYAEAKGGPRVLKAKTLDMFNKVTPLLAGGGVLKTMGGQNLGGVGPLRDVLRDAFSELNEFTSDYLDSMLRHDGIPSREWQILDVLGRVSSKRKIPDGKAREAMFRGICRDMTREEAVRVAKSLKAKGISSGEIPRPVRLLAAAKKDEKLMAGGAAAAPENVENWLASWDERFAAEVDRVVRKAAPQVSVQNPTALASKAKGATKQGKKKKIQTLVDTVRKTLARAIASEMEFNQPGAVRARLATDHSKFEAALAKADFLGPQMQARLIRAVTEPDVDDLLVADDTPDVDDTGADAQAPPTREERLEEQHERKSDAKDLAGVAIARGLVGSAPGFDSKKMEKTGLVKVIAEMSPESRRMFVAAHLPDDKRQAYLKQQGSHAELAALFEEAWAGTGNLRQLVEDSLFDDEKRKAIADKQAGKKGRFEVSKPKAKSADELADIPHLKPKVIAIHTMLSVADDLGPHHQALLKLLKNPLGQKASTTTHGTRIWEIAQDMKGAEIFAVRYDTPLLLGLRKLCKADTLSLSKYQWDKFVSMLQLPEEMRISAPKPGKGGVPKDAQPAGGDATAPATTGAADKGEKKGDKKKYAPSLATAATSTSGAVGDETSSEMGHLDVDSVEFAPAYWVMRLHRVVHAAIPSLSDTYSVVTRAQQVGKRWAQVQGGQAAPTDDDKKAATATGDQDAKDAPGAGPDTQAAFLRRIWDALDDKDRKVLQGKIPAAAKALSEGTPLEIQTRLDRGGGHVLKGSNIQTTINANKSAIVASFEDLDGKELLREWSNFAELSTMHDKANDLADQARNLDPNDPDDQEAVTALTTEMEALESQMARFWPSVRRDRLAWLQANLGGGTRMAVLGMLTKKLSGAMKGDPEFREAAEAAGLVADDYDAERLQFGYLMNKRRQLDTGLQQTARSKFSVLQLFRGSPTKLASFALGGGENKDINKGASQARKAQANMYLAKVRTTEAELSNVGADRSLSGDDRLAQAQQIRETAAAEIESSRDELEKRNEAFDKGRKNFQKGLELVGKLLFTAIISAATLGQGTVAVIVGSILGGIAREAGAAVARWVVQGDAYEHKDLARAIAIGAVKGALKAATAEALTALDAASAAMAADPAQVGVVADAAVYNQIAINASIGAAMRSAIVDIPANQLKYFLTVERPFRDFGRNLDVLLATQTASVTGRMLASVLGDVLGQAAGDVDTLFSQAVGEQPTDTAQQQAQAFFTQQAQTGVSLLMGQIAANAKRVKMLIKLGMKKIWGKYPERWKQLENESLLAMGKRKDLVAVGTAASLPSAADVAGATAALDAIADGSKTVDDLDEKTKVDIGLMIAYDKATGSEEPAAPSGSAATVEATPSGGGESKASNSESGRQERKEGSSGSRSKGRKSPVAAT